MSRGELKPKLQIQIAGIQTTISIKKLITYLELILCPLSNGIQLRVFFLVLYTSYIV
jgi:hypothetical protein